MPHSPQVCSEQKLYCKEWRRRKRMVMGLVGSGGEGLVTVLW